MAKTATEKKYIGGFAKEHVFNDGSALIDLELDLTDLQTCVVNDKGRIRITVARRRTPDKAGNTHYVFENAFKPKPQASGGGSQGQGQSYPPRGGAAARPNNNSRPQSRGNSTPSDDLPF